MKNPSKLLSDKKNRIVFKIFFMTISLSIHAGEPGVLENQSNQKTSNLYIPFFQIDRSQLHYIFGPDGDRVVSVNFSRQGTIMSKTIYDSKEERHRYIYTDACKRKECQQFIHP